MKRYVLILTLGVGFLSFAPGSWAAPVHLYENFFGTGNDDVFMPLVEEGQVALHFDLTDINDPMLTPSPTTDEDGYDPATMTIVGAALEFIFFDNDGVSDTVEVWAGYYDGDRLIKKKNYNLGGPWFPDKYATLEVDLSQEGLLGYLQDGVFDTIVLASTVCCRENDIILDSASLSADATPVPVPAASMLLFSGLVMLGAGGTYFRKGKER